MKNYIFSLTILFIFVTNAWASDSPDSLTGKVVCGYQGWFTAAEEAPTPSWVHYASQGRFEPGFAGIEAWPDVSELDEDEKYATPFKMADGSTAYVFSSLNQKTVRRHFEWMRDYGIDGVMLQRFPSSPKNERRTAMLNRVLDNVRISANETKRCWALMYDLSGKSEVTLETEVIADLKSLIDAGKIGKNAQDPAYLHHRGKPLIAVWGIGFNDNRRYSLESCLRLVRMLKNDPEYGGFSVMIGVPTYWRELKNDALNDALLHEIIREVDVVSPWTVGRYRTPEDFGHFVERVTKPDMAWCQENGVDYLPVVFPGFSWQNLMKGRGKNVPMNDIPRLGGKFLDAQYRGNIEAGATMIYQAMFDEMDEGTAIFKCTPTPPVGASRFLDMDGLPSDFYLRLVGRWARILATKTNTP